MNRFPSTVIADVHGTLGRYAACAAERFTERFRVGFADAQLFGAQGELEVVGQAQTTHIGIAVGDDPELEAVGQSFKGWMHLGKQFDLMARGEKYLKARFGQRLRIRVCIASVC